MFYCQCIFLCRINISKKKKKTLGIYDIGNNRQETIVEPNGLGILNAVTSIVVFLTTEPKRRKKSDTESKTSFHRMLYSFKRNIWWTSNLRWERKRATTTKNNRRKNHATKNTILYPTKVTIMLLFSLSLSVSLSLLDLVSVCLLFLRPFFWR